MAQPISASPNLGPASGQAFARAGTGSADELRAPGADVGHAGHARLLATGQSPHFIGDHALVMGLRGGP